MGSLRLGHDWANSLSLFTFMHWRRKWQPTPVFLPGESQGREAWWAAIYGVSHRIGHDWSNLAAAAAAKSLNWINHSSLVVSMKVKHMHILWQSNSTPRNIVNRMHAYIHQKVSIKISIVPLRCLSSCSVLYCNIPLCINNRMDRQYDIWQNRINIVNTWY